MTRRRLTATLVLTAALVAACADVPPDVPVGGPVSAKPSATPPTPTPTTPPVPPSSTPTPSTPTTPTTPPGVRPGDSRGATLMPVVQHGPRDRPRVALTFDADLTPVMRTRLRSGRVASYYNAALVGELRAMKVPATLFLTGLWMEEYPAQTRALAADPLFELGSHSYLHRGFAKRCYTLGYVPPAQMRADVDKAVRILDRLDPAATRWFRFPGGCYDGTAVKALAPLGLTAVQLDVPGADGFATAARPIVERVLAKARNGSVVVLHLHGGDNAPYTDEAIPAIVNGLRAKGFELVTMTELMRRSGG